MFFESNGDEFCISRFCVLCSTRVFVFLIVYVCVLLRHLVTATEVTVGLTESNGSLLPGIWRDSLHVTCWLTACTPGSAPGPTLGNEYGKTLPFYIQLYFTIVCGSTT